MYRKNNIPVILNYMKKHQYFLLLLLFALPIQSFAQPTFTLQSGTASCSDPNYSVDLDVTGFTNMISWQFSIEFDSDVIEYVNSTNPGTLPGIFPGGSADGIGLDTLNFSWFSSAGVSGTTIADNTIRTLNFQPTGVATNLSNISIISGLTPLEIVYSVGGVFTTSPFTLNDATVTVTDTQNPTISCSNNITTDSNGASTATVTGTTPATADNCSVQFFEYNLTGATTGSGTGSVDNVVNFNVGTTTVEYTVFDFANNSATCTFDVIVTNNNGGGGGSTTLDIYMDNLNVNCEDGTASINVYADNFTDIRGAQFSISWNTNFLQYVDTSNIVFNAGFTSFGTTNLANGQLGFSWGNNTGLTFPDSTILFTINYDLSMQAGITIPIVFVNDPMLPNEFTSESSFPFPMASTEFTLTNGSISIFDNIAPTITCPSNVTVPSTNGIDAVVNNIPPGAADNCGISDTTYTLTDSATSNNIGSGTGDASGTTFPIGTTIVEYTITDFDGNQDVCSFSVTVQTAGNITIIADSVEVDCAANSVIVGFPVENFIDIIAVQFTVEWDETKLEYVGIAQDNLTPPGTPGTTQINDGILAYGWFGASTTLPNGTEIILVEFNILDNTPGNSYDIIFQNTGVQTPLFVTTSSTFPNSVPSSQVTTINGNVTIIDDTPPTISCPMDVTVNATSSAGAVVNNIGFTASDNCGTPVVNNVILTSPPMIGFGDVSGTTFPVGTTQVTYTATDGAGLTASCSFNVTVANDPLMIDCPSNVIINTDPGMCSALMSSFSPTINSNPSNVNTISYVLNGNGPTGTGNGATPSMPFNVGTTTITFTVTDVFGGSETCVFTVDVIDNVPPIITCPSDISMSAISIGTACGNNVTWAQPVAIDNCTPNVQITSSHNSGDFFPAGVTQVTYIAIDNFGNVDSCSFNVTILDGAAPTISNCPTDTTIFAGTDCITNVTWITPTVTDDCDNAPTLTPSLASGSTFLPGTTPVTYTAMDGSGNTSTCTFNVMVIDTIAPNIVCSASPTVSTTSVINDPNNFITSLTSVSCDSVILTFDTPFGADNCLGVTVAQSPVSTSGSTFGIGDHIIQFEVTDASGNSSVCETTISVVPFTTTATANPDTICTGGNSQLLTADVPNSTYAWTGPNGFVADIYNPTVNNVTVADSGTYAVVITDTLTGCFANAMVDLVVIQGPEIEITSDLSYCTNGTIDVPLTATNTGSIDVINWKWTDPAGNTISTMQNTTLAMATPDSSGIYCVSALGSNGCITEVCVTITISDDDNTTDIISSCGTFLCVGETCMLNGTFSGSVDSVVWSQSGATGGLIPSTTNQANIQPLQNGIYTYTFTTYSAGCVSSANIAMQVSSPANVAPDTIPIPFNGSMTTFDVTDNDALFGSLPGTYFINITSDVSNGTLTDNGDGTFGYEPNEGFFGFDQFIYEICVDCQDQTVCSWAIATLQITSEDCLIPTVLTPNGDDINDTWQITCTGENAENEVIIYNRWGDEVYRAAPYNNDWGGTYNNLDLPDGTYFYIFKKNPDDTDPQKGAITIMR